jgi:hypothetical protein
LLAATLIVTTLAPAPALAQPVPVPSSAPSADDAKEAKRHFTVGNDLYRDGRFQDAVVEFDASYRLGGRPSALRNGADCRRQLNEYADAYDAYRVLLDRHRSQLSAAERAAVQKAIDELDALTGLLSVSATEDGAEIVVDDRVLARTPLATKLRLSVGSHRVVVRKAGFVSFESADLTLISKQTVTVDAKLAPEVVTGHLSVREDSGREVHVFVDDADKGPAPWEGDVAPGPHKLQASGTRFAAEPRTVTVERGQRSDVTLTARPVLGHLHVSVQPESAKIRIDDDKIGVGSWDGELPPGPHRIEVTAGDTRAVRDVVIERGETAQQDISLAGASESATEYVGFYWGVDAISPGILYSPDPWVGLGPEQGRSSPPGAGLAVRAGHNFGVFSSELVGAFFWESWVAKNVPFGRSAGAASDYSLDTFNGFVGPGARITSRAASLRWTCGAALGIAIRSFNFDRPPQSQPNIPDFPRTAGYVDPAILLDAGILLGGSPGVKLRAAFVGWMDFPLKNVVVGPDTSAPVSAMYSAPNQSYLLTPQAQIFLGVMLGAQFAH